MFSGTLCLEASSRTIKSISVEILFTPFQRSKYNTLGIFLVFRGTHLYAILLSVVFCIKREGIIILVFFLFLLFCFTQLTSFSFIGNLGLSFFNREKNVQFILIAIDGSGVVALKVCVNKSQKNSIAWGEGYDFDRSSECN